ncbi:MAG: ATP-binding protein [Succinivibrio sp.]|nr:ATP-binding protein [Succinivibrio sp.]
MHIISLPAKIEQLSVINELLHEVMTGELEQYLPKIELVVEELLANICNYAYDGQSGQAEFMCGLVTFDSNPCIRITLTDHGKQFDPFSASIEDHTTDDLEDRPIGGLGIYFVKHLASHFVYSRINDANIVDIYMMLNGQKTEDSVETE